MSLVVVATSAADAEAVEAVRSHHAQLAGALAVQVEALVGAAAACQHLRSPGLAGSR